MRTYGDMSVGERVELAPAALTGQKTVRDALTAFFMLLDADDADAADAMEIRQRVAAPDFVESGSLSGELLAALARDMHITWYDSADVFPTEAENERYRRKIIRDALDVYRSAGTEKALESVLRGVLPEMRIATWDSYGGQPYHFRISTGASETSAPVDVDYILRLIGEYKRAAAVLDGLSTDLRDKVLVRFSAPRRAGTIDYGPPGADVMAGEAIPGQDLSEAITNDE